jgi:predicted DCC family thiol-disulfide oxidoreductase YuxK
LHCKTSILIPRGKKVLLFDGVCNLCDGFVQFVLKRDKKGQFLFASLQSKIGKDLLEKYKVEVEELSTVVLIDGDQVYTHSDVPLQIAKDLGAMYRVFYPLKVLPKKWRNRVYDWIAANRYRFFGKKEACMLPQPEWRSRFLDVQ